MGSGTLEVPTVAGAEALAEPSEGKAAVSSVGRVALLVTTRLAARRGKQPSASPHRWSPSASCDGAAKTAQLQGVQEEGKGPLTTVKGLLEGFSKVC